MKEDKIENNYNMHFETGSNPTIFNNAKIEVHGDFITTSVKKPKPINEESREAHGEIPPKSRYRQSQRVLAQIDGGRFCGRALSAVQGRIKTDCNVHSRLHG